MKFERQQRCRVVVRGRDFDVRWPWFLARPPLRRRQPSFHHGLRDRVGFGDRMNVSLFFVSYLFHFGVGRRKIEATIGGEPWCSTCCSVSRS